MSNRARSVATNVEFPVLPLASAQILTMTLLLSYSCNKDRLKQQAPKMFRDVSLSQIQYIARIEFFYWIRRPFPGYSDIVF
jgi:hypothetical protein